MGESEAIMVIQCCACKRVKDGGDWREATPPVLDTAPKSHGFCPECESKAYAEMNRHYEILKALSAA